MNRGIYTVASGGLAAQARLDAVAENLANVGTAGYKSTRVLFRVRPLDESGAVPTPIDPILGRTAAQVAEVGTVRDFSQGPVRVSGNPLDVAITGEGFFTVATARGERFTRQGNFALDAEGYLVTAHGERVQGESGDIQVPQGDVVIGEDGAIRVDASEVGRLKLVTAGDPPALVPEGAALFALAPGANATPVEQVDVHVQAGAIESANVDPVKGMIEMVDVARGFESYMHALQRLDQVTEKSITDVGRV